MAVIRTRNTCFNLIPFLIVLIMVSGCQAQNNEQTDSAVYLSTIPATIDPTSTSGENGPAITATLEAGQSGITLATPSFLSFDLAKGILLSTGTSDTCELPCWNNLRFGVSDKADVQRVFASVLKADAGFDFFDLPNNIGHWLRQRGMPDSVYTGGYHWDFRDPTTGVGGRYALYAIMDTRDDKLVAFVEEMSPFYSYDVPTLQEILGQLGQPDLLVFYDNKVSQIVDVVIYYRQGIRVTVSIAKNLEDPANPKLCFDKDPLLETYVLSAPYSGFRAADMTPVQAAFGTSDDGESVEDMFGSSISEFMKSSESGQECIALID